MSDDEIEFISEPRRRLADDTGVRFTFAEAMREAGLVPADLVEYGPRRLWVIQPGNWCNPRYLRRKPAPLVFLGGDEFGNRPVCLRLPGGRLLCLNLAVPLRREPWEPEDDL